MTSVAVVSPTWPRSDTGYGIAVLHALKVYRRLFSSVELIYLGSEPAIHMPPGLVDDVTAIAVPRPAPAVRFLQSLASELPAVAKRFASPAVASRIAARLSARPTDAMVVEDVTTAACLLESCALTVRPKIAVHSHNVLSEAFSGLPSRNPLVRLAWSVEQRKIARFEAQITRLPAAFWSISNRDADEYRRRLNRSPDGTVSVSFSELAYSALPSPLPADFIYLGSADLRKSTGLRAFIAGSWPAIRARHPKARLILGGRGTENLNRPAQGILGFGYVSDENEFIQRAPFFINPQTVGSGIKIKSLVALRHGRVLISTPKGVEGIEGKAGRDYQVGEPGTDLHAVALRLLAEPETARATARAGSELLKSRYGDDRVEREAAELRPWVRSTP